MGRKQIQFTIGYGELEIHIRTGILIHHSHYYDLWKFPIVNNQILSNIHRLDQDAYWAIDFYEG